MKRELTERKQTQAELIGAEAKYRDLYENAPDMFCSVNPKTAIIEECNQTLATALGYTKEEILGKHISFVYHPDSENDRREVFRMFVESGDVRNAELELKRKNGSKIEVSLNVTAVRGEQGEILYSRSIWRDITDRKRVEKELRKSEDRYRSFYNKTPAMLHSIDRNNRLLAVSDQWLEVLGYERSEVMGRKSVEFLTEESRHFAKGQALPEFFKTGSASNISYQFVKKNGETVDILLSAITEYDEKGQFIRSLAVLQDVTRSARAEAALWES